MNPSKNGGDRTPLPVTIREMELHDLPTVFDLGERLFRADEYPNLYRTWDEYDLIQYFTTDGDYCLVAETDDEIVGFVIGTVIEKRRSAWSYGYLVWLGTVPEIEGRGVARRLLARLTELFIEAGARIMMVDTEAENGRALGFFERAGFGQPVEHIYLAKNLTGMRHYRRHREREAAAEEWERQQRRKGGGPRKSSGPAAAKQAAGKSDSKDGGKPKAKGKSKMKVGAKTKGKSKGKTG